ncbi:nucleotidyltransferase family protein [Oscillatoria amoena NRMC-F 0135]|uniref:Nucleotidyltransferase family protein n=1 Tax=Geitlerinema calcuttense NRMC-F 0142 TaxID=2922238 RepID=A0ABT7LZM1_9CYAN|nr:MULTISPECIES: nucleotidyltransferase family protein [Cyanophyceae]MDL5050391.1 nucleotidyltransferase family protein [Oscillatoria amoena NRMC-F 0135]MDL5054212.1 nucleotidyltransferase family protein [Oscillatoria laete-virens NRMC-F 0139]MDL5057461.1 nucleotidyltransferase family protein [Geitlerinema calcuttense NRMC-F 0142]
MQKQDSVTRNSRPAKAVILAAGKGTRMGELTKDLPKPMVEVNGKPVLQHIIEGLRDSGVKEIFIITGYCAEVIENFFRDGKDFGVSVTYGRQVVQDGTGKAPEIAKEWVGNDHFLMTYGDILVSRDNYNGMLEAYANCAEPLESLITVKRGEDVKKGAVVIFNEKFLLTDLVEKPNDEQLAQLEAQGKLGAGKPIWYNAGVYLFSPGIFSHTAKLEKSPRGEYELPDAIRGIVATHGNVLGYELQGQWVDVRDPGVLQEVQGIKL